MLLNYINRYVSYLLLENPVTYPHPCYSKKIYSSILDFWHHLFNIYSIKEPYSNYMIRKRY